MNINNLTNDRRKMISRKGSFAVIEYQRDLSVNMMNARQEYYMGRMGVRRRQLVCELDGENTLIMQAGAMQWTCGMIESTTGVKGAGDLMKKLFRGAITKESAVKPEYSGYGLIVFEPTYKHIILADAQDWGPGMVIENGMFLACDGKIKQSISARSNVSSAVAGGEGLFNLTLSGKGIIALESPVPEAELVEVILEDEELKIDGSLAVCWSSDLSFTVERSSKTLVGSAINKEGLVNVYRGTGRVLLSPVAQTSSQEAAEEDKCANSAKPHTDPK